MFRRDARKVGMLVGVRSAGHAIVASTTTLDPIENDAEEDNQEECTKSSTQRNEDDDSFGMAMIYTFLLESREKDSKQKTYVRLSRDWSSRRRSG